MLTEPEKGIVPNAIVVVEGVFTNYEAYTAINQFLLENNKNQNLTFDTSAVAEGFVFRLVPKLQYRFG
ncbi:hypothetical protein [Larkinella harenae]